MSTFNCLRQLWLWSFLQPIKIRTMMWCVSFNLGFAKPSDVSSPSSIFGQKGFGWIVASITHLNRPPMDRLHRACQRQRRPQKGLPCLDRHWDPPGRGLVCVNLQVQAQVHLVDIHFCFYVHSGSLGVICGCWQLRFSTNITWQICK